ncbi:MAG: PAS domain S-box protein [Sphingopyxis sp.]|jgi:PAS domain S-box-containing protein|uniref:sensor histidine kinase n=1 Tax=Sphingopyxis sp. TaxID=1908224 RepID=UPI001A472C42|nr:PAS domain S-box protein [Sphingopyxis sp.]MBL9066038.1 PAS domain S-box protein [Sphingopyxis sp.]HEV7343603.1 PAS domain S-box protein [Sphingopyxis sp.]
MPDETLIGEETAHGSFAVRESAAHLAALVEGSDDAIVSKTLDGVITSWNPAAERLFGYHADEIVGRSILTLIPEERHSEEAAIIERIRAGQRVPPFETVRRRKDGSLVDLSITVSPVRRADGTIIGASKIARDITERKAVEAQLARQAERLTQLNRAALLVSQDLDLDRIVQAVTDIATELSGARFGAFFYNVLGDEGESYLLFSLSGAPREAFERFGMPRNTAVFDPTFRGAGTIRSDDIRKDPRYGLSEPHHGMPEGHLPVVSYLAVPVVSRSGAVLGGLFFGHDEPAMFNAEVEELVEAVAAQAAVAMDNAHLHEAARVEIAARVRAEEELQLTLAEMRHRVKNTLAMVQAIAAQTFRETPSAERQSFEARVRALSDAHDLLTERHWGTVSAGEMIERALHAFDKMKPGRISLAGPHAEVPASRALLAAMALHELGTNAVKYGALSGDTGTVAVDWDIVHEGGRDRLRLRWSEFGGPPVVPPARTGFGTRMLERALRGQGGSAAIEFRPEGVCCTLELPA